MRGSEFKTVDGFYSYADFSRFKAWVEGEIKDGRAVEVPVEDSYAGINFTERWFRFVDSKSIWRLVYPDVPFKGYWGEVI